MKKELSRERAEFLASDFGRGFIRYCGFKAQKAKRGYFRSALEIRDHHLQQDGFVHAGVMAAMADHTAGYAAFTTVAEAYQILTVEFKINFLRPARGRELVCEAKVIREGSQIIVAESQVFDLDRKGLKKEAAKALVTLMAVPRERLHISSAQGH